jgi:hypothetical protein
VTKALARRAGVLAAGLAAVAATCSGPSRPAPSSQPARYVVSAYVPAAGEGGALKVLGADGRYALLWPPAEAQSALPLPAPDGRHAAVPDLAGTRGDGGRIAVIDTASRWVSWVRVPVAPTTLSWSPDSRRIAVLGRTGPGPAPVTAVDLATGRVSVLSLPPPGGRLEAGWRPAGGRHCPVRTGRDRSGRAVRVCRPVHIGRSAGVLHPAGTAGPVAPGGRQPGRQPPVVAVRADAHAAGGPGASRWPSADPRARRPHRPRRRPLRPGLPVAWLDDADLAVATRTPGGAEVVSVALAGCGRRRLAGLPPDTATPPTVFLVPASGVPPAAARYAF